MLLRLLSPILSLLIVTCSFSFVPLLLNIPTPFFWIDVSLYNPNAVAIVDGHVLQIESG